MTLYSATQARLRPGRTKLRQRVRASRHHNPRKNPMGGEQMTVDTVEKLLVDELKDLYSAENQITKALPKMAKAATTNELKTAFQTHLKEPEGQIKRLDRVFEILDKPSGGKTCKGMQGLIEEGTENMQQTEGEVRDAA